MYKMQGVGGFTGSVQYWSLGRHGDSKNAYGIVVDESDLHMYNMNVLYVLFSCAVVLVVI